METKNSKMFDDTIRKALKNHEVPFNSSEWAPFEQKLGKALKAAFLKKAFFAFIGVAVIGTLTFLYLNNLPNNNNRVENTIVQNTTSSNTVPSYNDNQNVTNAAEIEPAKLKPATQELKSQSERPEIKQKPEVTDTNLPVEEVKPRIDDKKKEIPPKELEKSTSPISEPAPPRLAIAVNRQVICAGEQISFFSSLIDTKHSYVWNFGNSRTSTDINPVQTYEQPGEYEVSLQVNTASAIYSAQVSVLVNPRPDADFDYEVVQEGLAYPQVIFNDKSTNALYWEWSFGDGKTSFEQNPVHVYFINADKDIQVSLSAINEFGCSHKTGKTIVFTNVFDLMAPNAFSPDGDGLNDYFIPKALEMYDIPFEMFIYDRGGVMVFSTKNKSYPWDGRIGQTGQIPETGTFVWIVILQDKNGKSMKYGGNVSIVK